MYKLILCTLTFCAVIVSPALLVQHVSDHPLSWREVIAFGLWIASLWLLNSIWRNKRKQ